MTEAFKNHGVFIGNENPDHAQSLVHFIRLGLVSSMVTLVP
jgi:hypothetical protein